MKIYTQDELGRKIEVEYESRVIEDIDGETPVTIKNYEQFKHCIQKSREQDDYIPSQRTKKYDNALGKLLRDNNDLYMQYRDRLDNEYRENYRKHYDR